MDVMKTLKRLEPLIAVCVLISLLVLGILLYQDQQLKKEISKNCGFGKEDYYCYCERSQANIIKNLMENHNQIILPENYTDVQVAG